MSEITTDNSSDIDALWERILRDMRHVRIGYPVEAAALLREHRERLTPKLLNEFSAFAADPMTHLRDEDYILHFHLITFFAEFRETRAYPLLVAAMQLSAEDLEYVFGDYLTETMGRTLAAVCDGDTALLEAYANDDTRNPWGRNACIVAITTRALEGDLAPQEAAERIERIGVAEAERQVGLPPDERDDIFLSCVVGELVDLRAISALPNIRQWFSQDLIDVTFQGDIKEVERRLLKDGFEAQQAEARQFDKGYVQDAVKELESWPMFSAPRMPEPEVLQKPIWPADGPPFERALPKVGRNDPCPCGSGKKYKKCCGA